MARCPPDRRLGPIIEARLDLCRAKGFDSAGADNMDGYTNSTGFALTSDDHMTFNVFVANAAHARGLSAEDCVLSRSQSGQLQCPEEAVRTRSTAFAVPLTA